MFNLSLKKKSSLSILYTMSFFLALACALPAYIQSSYLEDIFGLSSITIFYIIANICSLLAIFVFPKVIKKIGNYLSTAQVAIIFLASLFLLGFSTNYLLVFLAFIIMIVSSNLIWINMDVFVESFSSDASTGRTRTTYFTIANLAWIVSPSLSSYVFSLGGYPGIFISSALLIIPFLVIFSLSAKKIRDHITYKEIHIKETFNKMFGDKNLRGVFFLSLLLNMFYNLGVVFVPIYLNKVIGISWSELGWMFSLMLIPFILVELPAGIIADKYIGEKEMFHLGFAFIIISLCLFSYISSANPWVWVIILFTSRLGAALVEAMRESYFFKNVNEQDIDLINTFRATTPLGQLLGSVLASLVLLVLPISQLFFVGALVSCSAYYFLSIMKDTK